MKKITTFRLTASGIMNESEKVKTKNFSDGEAVIFFRKFLLEKGLLHCLTENTLLDKHVHYFCNFPVKIKFVIWQAEKDTETGKAVLWCGNRNLKEMKQEQMVSGLVVGDRIIETDFSYYILICVLKTFKNGMDVKDSPMMEYLIVSMEYVRDFVLEKNQGWIDIKKTHREQFAFDKIFPSLLERYM